MKEATLELSELLNRANELREMIPELADTDAFTERTVYYYGQQGLLPRASRRRGPGTTYPADFVDRLLFIRRLQKERSLTLDNIRKVMDNASAETIHDVARGLEPLEIRISGSLLAEDAEVHSDVMPLNYFDAPELARREASDPIVQEEFGSPADFLQLSAGSRSRFKDRRESYGAEESSSYPVGEYAELTVNRPLTKLQRKRLTQVVELLRSILEEED